MGSVTFGRGRALELLRLGCGRRDVEFREGQEEAIRDVVEGRGRLLVVQRTGWGKSSVYFIAIKLLREVGLGPALLVSPLLSLMRNQLAAARRMGVRAESITSENPSDWARIAAAITNGEVDVLLISPERLANEEFKVKVLGRIAASISLWVIDEAHCISDWGHDFRPHYRLIERIIRSLPRNFRLLATTATANRRVMEDLQSVLGPGLISLRGDLQRASLALQTIRLPGEAERLAWLAEQVPRLDGSGIIYTLTIRDANRVAGWLQSCGIDVAAYTSESEARDELEEALLSNRIKALVATTALGMGFDKPDLAFVIHYQTPGSVVAYYQQVGRAGRALAAARGVLLSGEGEAEITEYFIDSAFPTREEVAAVSAALDAAPEGLSVPALLGVVNLSAGRIEKVLTALSLEAPAVAVKQGPTWQLTPGKLQDDFWRRAERMTGLRRAEHAQMQEYVDLKAGHMAFLVRALDGDPERVTVPALAPLSAAVDQSLVRAAVAFVKRTERPIEPRLRWPTGGLPQYGLRGKIDEEHRNEVGRALCSWGDAGWGRLVRQGKYSTHRFDDALVQACVKTVRAWDMQPAPVWVTCVPSLRRAALVPEFGVRLAGALGLPFVAALVKTEARPEQKTMANSIQQARNVDGSLALDPAIEVPSGAVLLIDDMVDSRWTLTVAGWLLRRGGSGQVWPLVLAFAQTGQDP